LNFGYFDSHGSQVSAAGKLADTASFVGRILLVVLVTLILLIPGRLHVLMHGRSVVRVICA